MVQGSDAYTEMVSWAADNMTEDENSIQHSRKF